MRTSAQDPIESPNVAFCYALQLNVLSTIKTLRFMAALALALSAAAAQAQTFSEVGDAGQTLATAQTVPGGITQITRSVGFPGDVDLYKLTFDSTATVTFDGISSQDSNLMLFDAAGHALWGDDDSGEGFDAQIIFTVSPGTYYLAYGANNIEAANASGDEFCSNDSGNCTWNTTDVLDHFNATGSATFSYTVNLSQPTSGPAPAAMPVPTLAHWGLLGLVGVIGVATAGRMRRRQG